MFKPAFKIPQRNFYDFHKLRPEEIENLVFHIGMVELISYWKTVCSPEVIIRPHLLDDFQISWWKKLYFNGLGEFFYLNGIDANVEDFMNITTQGAELKRMNLSLADNEVIVPVGGGKDSAVSLELLNRGGAKILPMFLNPREASIRSINTAGFGLEDSAVVLRSLDNRLLELNKKGYLNGHTPFSSLLAFMNLLLAAATGIQNIALSNESSANESTVPGTNINHQYSKSVEFENDFREYYKRYIHKDVEYFSFLRPLNELRIAELFSGFPSHFDGFRSCNVGSKTDSWCGKCPKCLFTYIMLSPFVSQADLQQIFGKDLFQDESLQPIMDELTGTSSVKPFECVGTPEEVKLAIWAVIEQLNKSNLPVLLKNFLLAYWESPDDKEYKMLITQFDQQHNIPGRLLSLLNSSIENEYRKGFIQYLRKKFSGIDKILILGFGREGQSTFRLLKENFPKIDLAIADRNKSIVDSNLLNGFNPGDLYLGEDYQESIHSFKIVIKSPGIKLKSNAHYQETITSQTELFLGYYRKNTIGVTGTKGKSTTVSLIHHFLNKAGRDNVLLGNIGVPAFDRIDQIKKDTLIVFELSAHQLQDIKTSPHVAVLLNIFPEHLDHFDGYDAYFNAKTNVFKHQHSQDILIIHESLVSKVDLTDSQLTVFSAEDQSGDFMPRDGMAMTGSTNELVAGQTGVIGKHNENNVLAAALAVLAFGLPLEKSMTYLSDFISLSHRLEYAGTLKNIHFYNDSISTVPESTIAAVKALKDTDTLILGGFDRGLNYSQLVDFLSACQVRNFIFIGQVGKMLLSLFQKRSGPDQKSFFVSDLAAAFPIILEHTKPEAICLLSPAASSYDQFHNFEHRGDTFKTLIKQWKEK